MSFRGLVFDCFPTGIAATGSPPEDGQSPPLAQKVTQAASGCFSAIAAFLRSLCNKISQYFDDKHSSSMIQRVANHLETGDGGRLSVDEKLQTAVSNLLRQPKIPSAHEVQALFIEHGFQPEDVPKAFELYCSILGYDLGFAKNEPTPLSNALSQTDSSISARSSSSEISHRPIRPQKLKNQNLRSESPLPPEIDIIVATSDLRGNDFLRIELTNLLLDYKRAKNVYDPNNEEALQAIRDTYDGDAGEILDRHRICQPGLGLDHPIFSNEAFAAYRELLGHSGLARV